MLHQVIKILNENQILCRSHYICICLDKNTKKQLPNVKSAFI